MTITVLRPGMLMSVQDRGRHGHQHVGLCPGGAMDVVSLALANALVGNPEDAAAIEITVLGPDLEFERDTLVALAGADFESSIPGNRPVLLAAGARISITRALRGARGYLAVAGGIDVPPVLGSRSTYIPGRFGGFQGRVLKRGDRLPLLTDAEKLSRERFAGLKQKRGNSVRWSVQVPTVPDREPIVLHAIDGEHFAYFDATMQRTFFDTVWKIGPESNRMGFRLTGATLQRMNGAANNGASGGANGGTNGAPAAEILSGPTALGSVQVPANGTPIALMADHQTTGGYPRIAEIASADVPRLAQLGPNGALHFARCSLDMAADLRRDLRNRLEPALRAIAWQFSK